MNIFWGGGILLIRKIRFTPAASRSRSDALLHGSNDQKLFHIFGSSHTHLCRYAKGYEIGLDRSFSPELYDGSPHG